MFREIDRDLPPSDSTCSQEMNMPNQSSEYQGEGDALTNHSRRKWYSNPGTSLGARRYHELNALDSPKDGLAYQLLKNLANTKRSISELIERSRRTEWMKQMSSAQENKYTSPILEGRSDSGISLNKTSDNESSYDFTKKNSNSESCYTHSWNVDFHDNDQNLDSSVNVDTLLNDDYNSMSDKNYYDETKRGEKLEYYNSPAEIDKEMLMDTDGSTEKSIKGVLRNISMEKVAGDDKPSRMNAKKDRSAEMNRTVDYLTRFKKSRERLNNAISEIQSSSGVRGITKSSALIARMKGAVRRKTGSDSSEGILSSIDDLDCQRTTAEVSNDLSSESEGRHFFKSSEMKGKIGNSKFDMFKEQVMSGIGRSSPISSRMERTDEDTMVRAKRSSTKLKATSSDRSIVESEGSGYLNERKKSGTQLPLRRSTSNLSGIKRSTQGSITDILNNLDSINSQNLEFDIDWDQNQNISEENQYQFSTASTPSKENLPSPKISEDFLKHHFPNSNRKREEKLRSLKKNMIMNEQNSYNKLMKLSEFNARNYLDESTSYNQICSGKSLQSENNISSSSYMLNQNDSSENVIDDISTNNYLNFNISNNTGDLQNRDSTFGDVNTQVALIYLSETLIESAQRAEVLLMQKMKEYNDVVCRDPPDRSMREASCQANVPDNEPDHEANLQEMKEGFKREMNDKNNRIKQLESDKKKLRQAMKKLNPPVGRKGNDCDDGGLDVEIISDRIIHESSSDSLNIIDQRILEKEELVQALKLENNLLHTLLKEMKTELEQENATILSLAKKLEMSMIQTQSKQLQQQTPPTNCSKELENDVVRKLEEKLEQQEKMLKQEAMEARAVAKYVITKYKNLIQEYKEKVKSHQETVDKLTNALK